jgi:restriction endonuclease S subunit
VGVNLEAIKHVNLGSVANITTGLVVSRKKSVDENGYKYKMLSLRSFNENGYIEFDYLDEFISTEKLPQHQLTQKGDVVVRLSYPNTAVYISEKEEGFVITSLFVVIRAQDNFIMPEYIKYYLNSEKAKRQLLGDIIGSAIAIVKISSIKEFSLPVYTMDYQEKVISISNMMMKEKDILKRLTREKEKLHKAITSKLFD